MKSAPSFSTGEAQQPIAAGSAPASTIEDWRPGTTSSDQNQQVLALADREASNQRDPAASAASMPALREIPFEIGDRSFAQ